MAPPTLPTIVHTGAIFGGPRRCYRYRLTRVFATGGNGDCAFLMLNPSTADATVNDPTVRRCLGYAARWGYQRVEVVNLFALRSTDPAALRTHPDPVGPDCTHHIVSTVRATAITVLAWGAHGAVEGRGMAVWQRLVDEGLVTRLYVLGRTKAGHPQHPLYLPADRALVPAGAPPGLRHPGVHSADDWDAASGD